MLSTPSDRDRVLRELDALPDEYLPFVLQLVRTFRETITLQPATISFQHGWTDARTGQIAPIAELWDDIDTE